jgi:hypothetical protein
VWYSDDYSSPSPELHADDVDYPKGTRFSVVPLDGGKAETVVVLVPAPRPTVPVLVMDKRVRIGIVLFPERPDARVVPAAATECDPLVKAPSDWKDVRTWNGPHAIDGDGDGQIDLCFVDIISGRDIRRQLYEENRSGHWDLVQDEPL